MPALRVQIPQVVREAWIAMFESGPSDWPEDLSVMSNFKRKRWANIKKEAEKWRNWDGQ